MIIFNECLYYINYTLKTLQRYEGSLANKGIITVSMCKTTESWKVWNQVDKYYSTIDAVSVSNLKSVC